MNKPPEPYAAVPGDNKCPTTLRNSAGVKGSRRMGYIIRQPGSISGVKRPRLARYTMGRPGQAPAESGYEIDPDGPLHSRVADEEVAHIKSLSQFGGERAS